jgi:putative peptidoglycan lipid II flippase
MKDNLLKNTAKVSFMILLSRLLGLVRDLFMAAFLGASPVNDAFLAAFKFTNLFRSIFAEGAMNLALLPTINQAKISHGENYLKVLKAHLLALLLLVLTTFTIIILTAVEPILSLTNPGFNQSLLSLAIKLTYITFPYLTLVSVASFYGALLQNKGYFLPYSCNSIIMNIVLILACYLNFSSEPVYSLAYGVLISGFLELFWIIFAAARRGIKIKPRFPIVSIYTRKALKTFIPGVVTAGIFQISLWCDLIILSYYPGGMSYLYFADRFIQLPLALFGTAASIVLLPVLSANNNKPKELFEQTFLITFILILPSAIGLFLLSKEILTFFLYRGAFTEEAVLKTSALLKLLAIAVPFQSLGKILATRINATGNTKNTMFVSIGSLIINVVTSLSLMQKYGYLSVGYGTIISSISYFLFLSAPLLNFSQNNLKELLKSLISSSFLYLYLYYFSDLLPLVFVILSSIGLYFTILALVKSFLIEEGLKKILYKIK